ncbi:BLUF domain-containing protein [Aurantibacter sp.]|uniref:BLUF domain-containing protein n=1 Tax=Aurantibacter sp. TaxID=2807103 RepID=UPI0032664828
MFQLTYISVASPTINTQNIKDILSEARLTNSQKNVTGCLVYYNQEFVQILEGKRSDVIKIYGKIKKDNRHHNVKKLWDGDVSGRYFNDWNMAYYHGTSDLNGEEEKMFLKNMQLLSEFSSTSTSSLLMFWSTVRNLLNNDPVKIS